MLQKLAMKAIHLSLFLNISGDLSADQLIDRPLLCSDLLSR